jgi:hypothetical protein
MPGGALFGRILRSAVARSVGGDVEYGYTAERLQKEYRQEMNGEWRMENYFLIFKLD